MSTAHNHNHLPTNQRNRQIRRITWIGLVLNILLTGLKFAAGILGHSQAIVADAVHSASDLGTDLVLLIGIRAWSKPRDKQHPFGHERIETLLALFMGIFLALVGVWIVQNSLRGIEEAHLGKPGLIALIAAGISIVSKETMYRWTKHVGCKTSSMALIANAWHHRSDAMSSLPAGLAVLGAILLPSKWAFLDHIGALVVCIFLFHAAYKIISPAVAELLDAVPKSHVPEELVQIIAQTPGVSLVHNVRARSAGARVLTDAHIEVAPDITVTAGHDIAERVKHRVLAQLPEVTEITIHVEPHGDFERHPNHLKPIEDPRQPSRPDCNSSAKKS
ncbi:MAG: cation diffusion facilitator family transporter [Actinobacteria bacterium]|nr:cation diffusion facilitator family transporter [Actinomycetota bacterium]